MKIVSHLSRILLGIVFLFSGFVKGVDPLGTAYKIGDYFVAYGMQWAEPLSLALSIVLCAFEFSLGAWLLLNVRIRLASLLTFLMMVFFTILTFFDAIYNPVPDCGCFGDAIKLTNWETFYKNLVFIVLAYLTYRYRKQFKPCWSPLSAWFMLILVPVLFIWFSVYNYRNLPMVDFTAWKPGSKMIPDTLKPARYFLIYQNNISGEEKEYLSHELPWQDSVWMSEWTFKNQRVDDPNHYPAPNFKIQDTSSNDLTMNYLHEAGYLFCIVSPDLMQVKPELFPVLERLYDTLQTNNYRVIGLCGSSASDIAAITASHDLTIQWFQSDDIELKTMIRSNPGLVLLKDATVIKKWHYRKLPPAALLMNDYPLE